MPDDPDLQPEPSFEQALSQLERIVASLERGEPELTSALAKYEKGVVLLSQCHRLLEKAEQSVALLTGVDAQGNPVTAPFDATATLAREAVPPAVAPEAPVNPVRKRRTADRPSPSKSPTPSADDPLDSSDPPF
jgi:exodeoxyribonuclease VII small subunit